MPLTWYLIFILHILPSLVYSLYPNYSIALVPCLHTFSNRDSFIILLVYSICLLSLNLSFSILYGVFLSNFWTLFSFQTFYFLTYTVRYNKEQGKIQNKTKNKIITLAGGGQWGFFLYFLLTFSGAILRPLLIFSIFFFILFCQASSLFHHGPNLC